MLSIYLMSQHLYTRATRILSYDSVLQISSGSADSGLSYLMSSLLSPEQHTDFYTRLKVLGQVESVMLNLQNMAGQRNISRYYKLAFTLFYIRNIIVIVE